MRRHPHLLEVNARLWLDRLSAPAGARLTLEGVPDPYLRSLAEDFDLLWAMGVWRRSAAGARVARSHEGVRAACDAALPRWRPEDVEGSPYAVADYTLDPALGEPAAAAALRRALHGVGMRLILDFVPNHVAIDHPWTRSHPQRFVGGRREDLERDPAAFFVTPAGDVLAHGRDPHFPPWTDTAQLDFSSRSLRDALVETLLRIAAQADGVRCDMAMLALNDVFERTWGARTGRHAPSGEFWEEAIGRVRARHPEFLFIAEAYWGLEGRLLELGFDFAYDKHFYDLLRAGSAGGLRAHLAQAGPLLPGGVRFLENHDEPRAAGAFEPAAERAAAVVLTTLPGMRLVHDGQIEGRRRHLPVQLVRAPEEAVDGPLSAFHRALLALARDPIVHDGAWAPAGITPDGGGPGADGLLAWSWSYAQRRRLAVVNYGPEPARGRVAAGPAARWLDLLPRGAAPIRADGALHVELGPWAFRILETPAGR